MDVSNRIWSVSVLLCMVFLLQFISVSTRTLSSRPLNLMPSASMLARSLHGENSSEPNYELYHRSDVLLSRVQELVERHSSIMTMEVLKSGKDGYESEMTVVTVEPGGRDTSQDVKMRLLFDFGQHGREMITSEVAFRLLQMLGGEVPVGEVSRYALKRILPHTIIKIVPIENLNGRKKVEGGDHCERKNGRGVDINRNWAIDWGVKEKDYDPSEEYPGPYPFSEPETILVRDLAVRFQPHVWVNVHSGMEALFMPYDHRSYVPKDGAIPMESLLQTINALHCKSKCVVGSGGGSVGYLAHGTATDYMYEMLKVPMAFTWEIYGDLTQPEYECFQMFNPGTQSLLEKVLANWSNAFLTLLANVPSKLRDLPTRTTHLPVWHWESFSELDISVTTDADLTNSSSADVGDEIETRLDWASDLRTESGMSNGEKLLLESILLISVVMLLLVGLRFSRCSGNLFPLPFPGRCERFRRIPV